LLAALPRILRSTDATIVIAGSGDASICERIDDQVARSNGRVVFTRAASEALVHRMFAGADLVLVPSRREPCGLVQLFAQRYGALPVVRASDRPPPMPALTPPQGTNAHPSTPPFSSPWQTPDPSYASISAPAPKKNLVAMLLGAAGGFVFVGFVIGLAFAVRGKAEISRGAPGMGLSTMRYRARALGGELTIQSHPGEGTVVSCEVPQRPSPPATPAS
jgi:hypothetical protein